MSEHHPPIRSLILLGGVSKQTGSPKHLLPIPSSLSETGCEAPLLIHMLYLHHIFQVKHGDPLLRTVTLSVRDEAQRDELKALLQKHEDELPIDLNISYVQDSLSDLGPSAGLVAARRLDGHAHWLVTGCNYPLFSRSALEALRNRHHTGHKAITCFVNSRGHTQPLLAIWTARALEKLAIFKEEDQSAEPGTVLALIEQEGDDEEQGIRGKAYENGVLKVTPSDNHWTTNVDDDEDWTQVEEYIQSKFAESDP